MFVRSALRTALAVVSLVAWSACADEDPGPTGAVTDDVGGGADAGFDAADAAAEDTSGASDAASDTAGGDAGVDAPDPMDTTDGDTAEPDGSDGDAGASDAGDTGVMDADEDAATDAGEDATDDSGTDVTVDASPDASEDTAPDAPPSLCPPTGPFGTGIGDTVADVTLMDCDGGTHHLADLCDADAAWIFLYAGWCPPCQRRAASAAAFYASIAGSGDVEAWFVVSETASYAAPGPADCAAARDRFGLTMTVLYDPEQALPEALGTEYWSVDAVLGPGNTLVFTDQYGSDDDVADAMEPLLAR